MKLLEENTGVNLQDSEFGKAFLDVTLKVQQKKKYIKWTSSRLKTLVLQMSIRTKKVPLPIKEMRIKTTVTPIHTHFRQSVD